MTIQEIAQHISARTQNATDKVRQLLQTAEVAEFTVYSPPTKRWVEILTSLGLKELESRAICATCYNSDEGVFAKIESLLKKKYASVLSTSVDDMGFRHLFVCGKDKDKEPELVLMVNYYEDTREAIKAEYGSDNSDADTDDADNDLEVELDSDPFA